MDDSFTCFLALPNLILICLVFVFLLHQVWCDWLLCHSMVWNPPPTSRDYHVGYGVQLIFLDFVSYSNNAHDVNGLMDHEMCFLFFILKSQQTGWYTLDSFGHFDQSAGKA